MTECDPTTGMFPDRPMAPCPRCGRCSYMVGSGADLCTGCALEANGLQADMVELRVRPSWRRWADPISYGISLASIFGMVGLLLAPPPPIPKQPAAIIVYTTCTVVYEGESLVSQICERG